MKKLIRNSLSVAVVSLLSASAFSEMYIGASVGQTDHDLDGLDKGTSVELKGGYKFNEYVGVEGSYLDLGDADVSGGSGSVSVDGFKVAVVGFIPVAETVDIYGKLGLYSWDADYPAGSDDGSDINYGVGVAWGVADNVKVNLGYDIYELDEEDANNVNLGLTYSF